MTRDELQKQARDAWYGNKCCGTIATGVGTGKSHIAINIHNELWFSGMKVLLVTPTIVLHEVNWKAEYEKAQCEVLYQTLDRACYVSLFKYSPDDYDLIIMDEAHNLSEANYDEFIRYMNPQKTKVLALTGTPPKRGDKRRWFDKHFPIVYQYTINDSAANGVVNEFRLNVLALELDDTKKNIAAGSKQKPFLNTEKKHYEYLTRKIEQAIYGGTTKDVQWTSLARKRFLENLDSRIFYAKKLRDKYLKNHRSIIFAPTIEKAEQLCPNAIHSKSNSDLLLEKFASGSINMISSVRMLNEGITLPQLERGLICKLDSTDKTIFQQIGRLLRNPEGISEVFIIIYRGTVEEKYFNTALQTISKDRVKFLSVADL